MLTEDYIMRMISQVLAVIMTALGLKKAGKYREALQSFAQAKEILLGMDANIMDQVDEAAVLDLLTNRGNLDLDRLRLLADIYSEEGEIYHLQGLTDNSQFAYQRGLRLYLEAVLAGDTGMSVELIDKIEVLRHQVNTSLIREETCLALLDYLDRLLNSSDAFLDSAKLSRTHLVAEHASLSTRCDPNQV
jgi:tetratricopeptide (TPR) repeat protein